jgi:hypothetical protein
MMVSSFYIFIKMKFAIKPLTHYPKTHFSIVPSFQHSKWGEAPKAWVKAMQPSERIYTNQYNKAEDE